jgi:nucleoside-diphosphate-sugar epimerase
MKVLVTGAAGFIGFSLIRQLLARGDEVIGIDNCNDYYQVSLKRDRLALLAHDRFTFIERDFADYPGLVTALEPHAFDAVVHLGAQAGVRYSIENLCPVQPGRPRQPAGNRAPPQSGPHGLCQFVVGLWRQHQAAIRG